MRELVLKYWTGLKMNHLAYGNAGQGV